MLRLSVSLFGQQQVVLQQAFAHHENLPDLSSIAGIVAQFLTNFYIGVHGVVQIGDKESGTELQTFGEPVHVGAGPTDDVGQFFRGIDFLVFHDEKNS